MSKIKRSYQARGFCVQPNRGGGIHDIELRDSKSCLFLCHKKNNNYLLLKIKDGQTYFTVWRKHYSDLTYAVTNKHTGMLRLNFIPYELMVKNVCTFIDKIYYSKSAIITDTAKTVPLPYTVKK